MPTPDAAASSDASAVAGRLEHLAGWAGSDLAVIDTGTGRTRRTTVNRLPRNRRRRPRWRHSRPWRRRCGSARRWPRLPDTVDQILSRWDDGTGSGLSDQRRTVRRQASRSALRTGAARSTLAGLLASQRTLR